MAVPSVKLPPLIVPDAVTVVADIPLTPLRFPLLRVAVPSVKLPPLIVPDAVTVVADIPLTPLRSPLLRVAVPSVKLPPLIAPDAVTLAAFKEPVNTALTPVIRPALGSTPKPGPAKLILLQLTGPVVADVALSAFAVTVVNAAVDGVRLPITQLLIVPFSIAITPLFPSPVAVFLFSALRVPPSSVHKRRISG